MILTVLLTMLLVIDGLLLGLLVLIQKGKNSMGLGSLGGGAQTIFGGSGGQDMFQKATWVCGVIFMAGSLALAILQARDTSYGRHMGTIAGRPTLPISIPAKK